MIEFIIILCCQILLAVLWFKIGQNSGYNNGYDAREEKFQEGPIIFSVGNETALTVSRVKGQAIPEVNIVNPKLVKFIK